MTTILNIIKCCVEKRIRTFFKGYKSVDLRELRKYIQPKIMLTKLVGKVYNTCENKLLMEAIRSIIGSGICSKAECEESVLLNFRIAQYVFDESER